MITATTASTELHDHPVSEPTVWGLDASMLHDRFWAARGVQVVRQGEASEIVKHAELYLLTDRDSLSIFRLSKLIDSLSWLKPQVLFARIHDTHDPGYRERVIADDNDNFVRFERVYRDRNFRLGRVAVTSSEEIAQRWMTSQASRDSWRKLRRSIPPNHRTTISVDGCVFNRRDDRQVNDFVHELVNLWRRPDATISRARKLSGDVWSDKSIASDYDTRFVGPVWIGTGRDLDGINSVVGPAVLWDKPELRPTVESLQWHAIEPMDHVADPQRDKTNRSLYRVTKRVFDIVFALAFMLCTLPLYPLIMLAIFIEDGRPFFFPHRRESLGGREFPCLKFRTMYNNADEIKKQLQQENQADGPQFFIEDDPRITKVGRFMRKCNIDEFPQFFNVLLGQMSVVGPRPSPYKENQYSPAWREVRLSVRPGVTGLWQVKRSREPGKDFQEWIRYDINYVENASWKMDAYILWGTFKMTVGIK
jgi:lipopolysaccharide/colanic/teichoic acid biosynthesis glycosyltransferase